MRFLLDDDAKPSPKRFSNGRVLALAISENRILVTHDQDFIKHEYPEKQPGIILIKIPPRNFVQLKASMKSLLSEKATSGNFINRVFLLYEDRYEDFPFSWKTIKS